MPLRAPIPDILRPVEGSPEDERAFDAYAERLLLQLGILACVTIAFFTVGWWPLDPVVMPEHLRPMMSTLRTYALVVETIALLFFLLVRPEGRLVFASAVVFYAALLGVVGHALSIAGPESVHLLADAMIGIVPAAFMPFRRRHRLPAMVFIGGSLVAGYFLSAPALLDLPAAASQISFCVFAILFTVIIGDALYRVIRRAFFARINAERAREELRQLTDRLSGIVDERTAELRALAAHLETLQENERRRIAADLHDDLGQNVTAMRYAVARLATAVADGSERAPLLLEDVEALLDGASTTLRAVVASLSPRILEEHGLEAAALWLTERIGNKTAVTCVLEVEPTGAVWEELDRRVALVAFRVLQEGTTNAMKHGEPKRIDVTLELDPDTVRIEVKDDGNGFDAAGETAGFGLFSLRERVQSLGGRLSITTAAGQGARITATLPRDHDDARPLSAPMARLS